MNNIIETLKNHEDRITELENNSKKNEEIMMQTIDNLKKEIEELKNQNKNMILS